MVYDDLQRLKYPGSLVISRTSVLQYRDKNLREDQWNSVRGILEGGVQQVGSMSRVCSDKC
jgi:hypothetical protein